MNNKARAPDSPYLLVDNLHLQSLHQVHIDIEDPVIVVIVTQRYETNIESQQQFKFKLWSMES